MEHLTVVCEDLLQQLTRVLSVLTNEEFVTPSTILGGSTIGEHVRHTIEFFCCLKDGMRTGIVNYDKRARDEKLENDRFQSINAMGAINRFLRSMHEDAGLVLEVCYRKDGEDYYRIDTSYMRELVSNLEHAIHHMAIIKIGLGDVAGHIWLPADFGVAPSTARHRATLSASGLSRVRNIADRQED